MLDKFFTYSLGLVGAALFSFFTVSFLTRIMVPDQYGRGMLYITVITFLFYLCDFGMDQSFIRFFYERKTHNAQTLLLYQTLGVVFLGFLLVSGILLLTYRWILNFFFTKADLTLTLMICAGVFVFALNRFVLLMLRVQQMALLYSIGRILTSASYLLILFIIYSTWHLSDFTLIIWGRILSLGLVSVFLILMDFKHWKFNSKIFSEKVDFMWKPLLNYGYPFIFTFILTWGFLNLDRILLLKFSNYGEVGIYSAAFSLSSPILMLQTAFTTLWPPILVKYITEKSPEVAASYFSDVFKMMTLLMGLAILLIIMCKPILLIILGRTYQSASDVFVWLLLGPFFYLLSEISVAGIVKSKKSTWNLLISCFTLIANVISCLFLIPKYGAIGAAISLSISYAVFFFLRIVIAQRYLTIEYSVVIFITTMLLIIGAMISQFFSIWFTLVFITFLLLFNHKEIKKIYIYSKDLIDLNFKKAFLGNG